MLTYALILLFLTTIMICVSIYILTNTKSEAMENEWYDIIVHRKKLTSDPNATVIDYAFELEVLNDTTKEQVFKKILTASQYKEIEDTFNLEHMEFINDDLSYILYTHTICDTELTLRIINTIENQID
jgi:hypothetical protein